MCAYFAYLTNIDGEYVWRVRECRPTLTLYACNWKVASYLFKFIVQAYDAAMSTLTLCRITRPVRYERRCGDTLVAESCFQLFFFLFFFCTNTVDNHNRGIASLNKQLYNSDSIWQSVMVKRATLKCECVVLRSRLESEMDFCAFTFEFEYVSLSLWFQWSDYWVFEYLSISSILCQNV